MGAVDRHMFVNRLRDFACLFGFVCMLAYAAIGVSRAIVKLDSPLMTAVLLFGSVGMAWVLADLTSGAVHYLADNFGSPSTPLVGRWFIAPFREHHTHPNCILEHDFFERNGNNAAATIPALLAVGLWGPSGPWEAFLSLTLVQTAIWVALTNEIHALAHRTKNSGLVAWLQKHGVILSPRHHAAHHGGNASSSRHADHYCITSGFCDRLVSRASRDPRTA